MKMAAVDRFSKEWSPRGYAFEILPNGNVLVHGRSEGNVFSTDWDDLDLPDKDLHLLDFWLGTNRLLDRIAQHPSPMPRLGARAYRDREGEGRVEIQFRFNPKGGDQLLKELETLKTWMPKLKEDDLDMFTFWLEVEDIMDVREKAYEVEANLEELLIEHMLLERTA